MFFFNRKIWSRKSLASLLILAFLASIFAANILLPKKEAKAQFATLPMQIVQQITQKISWVKDYAVQKLQKLYSQITSQIQQWTKSDILQQRALREAWNQTRKDLLDELVNNILDSIQDIGGGETAFVIDWDDFLGGQTEQYFEGFVYEELNQANMCDVFDQEVTQSISAGNEPSFAQQEECPISDPNAFFGGTSQGEAFWDDWLQMIRPAGNPFGAYMIASDEKLERELLGYTEEMAKLIANEGHQGTTDTPGIVQSYAAQRASMMDLDYLLNADDLSEYFSSVIDAFINRIVREGLRSMQTSTYTPQGQPPQFTPTQPVVDLSYIKINYDTITSISNLLGLIEENLTALKTEQAKNGLSTAQTDVWLAQADQAFFDFDDLILAAEQAIAAELTGDQSLINQTIANFKTIQTAAINSLRTLLNTAETNLQKLSVKLDDFNIDIVDQTNSIITQYNSYGN